MRDSMIGWDAFMAVDLRVGRVVPAEPFPAARRPTCILHVDFGPEIGVRKSSTQITAHYTSEALLGRLVVGVVNLPPRQIGPRTSECLVTGFHDTDGHVRLCVSVGDVASGTRLL